MIWRSRPRYAIRPEFAIAVTCAISNPRPSVICRGFGPATPPMDERNRATSVRCAQLAGRSVSLTVMAIAPQAPHQESAAARRRAREKLQRDRGGQLPHFAMLSRCARPRPQSPYDTRRRERQSRPLARSIGSTPSRSAMWRCRPEQRPAADVTRIAQRNGATMSPRTCERRGPSREEHFDRLL